MLKKWDGQKTLLFVKLYAKHRCLWDNNEAEYKSRSARDNAIDDIIRKMGIDGMSADDVKCKIRIIRNAYINEKKKILHTKRTTIDGQKVNYVCNLPWFPIADQFLSKVIRKRTTKKYPPGFYSTRFVYGNENEFHNAYLSVNDEISQQSDDDNSSVPSHELIECEELCREGLVKIEKMDEEFEDTPTTIVGDFPFEFSQSNEHETDSKCRQLNENNVVTFVHSEPLCAENTNSDEFSSNPLADYSDDGVFCGHKKRHAKLNEFDLFAKNIALQLQWLPLENALEVQKKIHDLLLSERLKIIRQNKAGNTCSS